MMAAQLNENQGHQEAFIGAVMTVTVTDGVPRHGDVLEIAEAPAGEAELRSVTARANHGRIAIRGLRRDIECRPTEELPPRPGIRCKVPKSEFNEE
jgi:hypothetical protein